MNLKVSNHFFCFSFFKKIFSSFFQRWVLVLKRPISVVFLCFQARFYLINVSLFHLLFFLVLFVLMLCLKMIHHNTKITEPLFLFAYTVIHNSAKRINWCSLCFQFEAVIIFSSKLLDEIMYIRRILIIKFRIFMTNRL